MEFHLGDVLSITTNYYLSPSGYKGTHDILDFMINGNALRSQDFPSEATIQKCRSNLIDQFPHLATDEMDSAVAELDKMVGEKAGYEERKEVVMNWLAQQVNKYGEKFTVKRLPSK